MKRTCDPSSPLVADSEPPVAPSVDPFFAFVSTSGFVWEVLMPTLAGAGVNLSLHDGADWRSEGLSRDVY